MIPLRVDILRTRFAFFNALLILVNVFAFLHEITLSPQMGRALVYSFGLIPAHEQLLFARNGIGIGQAILPMFTSMFLHGGRMNPRGHLLDVRSWLGAGPHDFQSGVKSSDNRCEWGNLRRHGGIHRAVSASARDNAYPSAALVFYRSNSRVSNARLLVLSAVFQRGRIAGDDRSRRSRMVGARRRIRPGSPARRRCADEDAERCLQLGFSLGENFFSRGDGFDAFDPRR